VNYSFDGLKETRTLHSGIIKRNEHHLVEIELEKKSSLQSAAAISTEGEQIRTEDESKEKFRMFDSVLIASFSYILLFFVELCHSWFIEKILLNSNICVSI